MNKCKICDGQLSLKASKIPGYLEKYSYEIFECSNCGCSIPLPQVEVSDIYELIYAQGIEHPGYDRYWKYFNEIKKIKNPMNYLANLEINYYFIQQVLQKYKTRGQLKVLEIGSGLGYLTYAINKQGFVAKGIDISREAVMHASKKFGPLYSHEDLYMFSKLNSNKFDIVISTETIEHVADITNFISAMVNLVKPGGKLLLTTPNKSFFGKLSIWESSLPPVHLWWLSEKSIEFIAHTLNCKLTFYDFRKYHRKNILILNNNHYKIASNFQSTLNNDNLIITNQHLDLNEKKHKMRYNLFKYIIWYFIFLRKLSILALNKVLGYELIYGDRKSSQMGIIFEKEF